LISACPVLNEQLLQTVVHWDADELKYIPRTFGGEVVVMIVYKLEGRSRLFIWRGANGRERT